MHVCQARDQPFAASVDALHSSRDRNRGRRRDGGDSAILDEHRGIGQRNSFTAHWQYGDPLDDQPFWQWIWLAGVHSHGRGQTNDQQGATNC